MIVSVLLVIDGFYQLLLNPNSEVMQEKWLVKQSPGSFQLSFKKCSKENRERTGT